MGARGGNAGPDLSYVGFRRSREWLDLWLLDPHAWKKDALMPRFRLARGDRRAVVGYLSSLKGFAPGAAPWERARGVERGRRIYLSAGCVACHGPGGSGGHPNNNVPGGVIPALRFLTQTYARDELKERVRLGARPVKADPTGPSPLVSMPAWGEVLPESDIEAVADYLLAISPAPPPGAEW